MKLFKLLFVVLPFTQCFDQEILWLSRHSTPVFLWITQHPATYTTKTVSNNDS